MQNKIKSNTSPILNRSNDPTVVKHIILLYTVWQQSTFSNVVSKVPYQNKYERTRGKIERRVLRESGESLRVGIEKKLVDADRSRFQHECQIDGCVNHLNARKLCPLTRIKWIVARSYGKHTLATWYAAKVRPIFEPSSVDNEHLRAEFLCLSTIVNEESVACNFFFVFFSFFLFLFFKRVFVPLSARGDHWRENCRSDDT